jgi:hypothetical protein
MNSVVHATSGRELCQCDVSVLECAVMQIALVSCVM